MSHTILALLVLAGLILLLIISAKLGWIYGKWQQSKGIHKKLEVLSVAEGALFALLGLLVAFTFTGAYERFEARKMHIIEEANAIDTVDLRISLMAPQTQSALREAFRQYVDSRIKVYETMEELHIPKDELAKTQVLKDKLWEEAVAASKATNNQASTLLLLPAVNQLYDVANTRVAITKIHPPVVIFALLVLLAALSSFLAGYSTSGGKHFDSLYILSYIVITAFTIYIIIDLEYPRLGFIRVRSFDVVLTDARKLMH